MRISSYKSSVLLTSAYRIIRAKAYESLEKHDINATQWSILGLVYEAENGITLSEVASIIVVKKPLITLLVDGLEDKGLVERKVNEDDSRSKKLFLTSKGKAFIKTIEDEIQESFKDLFKDVSDKEFETYTSVLERVIKNAE